MSEAIYRYSTAKGFFQSSVMIVESPERNTTSRELLTILSIYMLQGFALELYLKAWLLAEGRSSSEVRAYGHKLEKLYTDAKDKGLPEISYLDDFVKSLSKGHENFTFRYLNKGDEILNLNWRESYEALDELDYVVDVRVGASASHGLTPRR